MGKSNKSETISTKKKYLISAKVDSFLQGIYEVNKYIGQYYREVISSPFEWNEFVNQCYKVGHQSTFWLYHWGNFYEAIPAFIS